ncbi:MAG: T9SS type A sorting domain-containing protein, partial [Tannerella sp.]|nr:T9SS type A sorting domain-containing protein [Tannerella sp.]
NNADVDLPCRLYNDSNYHILDNPYFFSTKIVNLYEFNNALFPNPANDFVNITISLEKKESVKITLYDLSGKLLQQHSCPNPEKDEFHKTININNLNSGIYIIKAIVGNKIISEKVIKK